MAKDTRSPIFTARSKDEVPRATTSSTVYRVSSVSMTYCVTSGVVGLLGMRGAGGGGPAGKRRGGGKTTARIGHQWIPVDARIHPLSSLPLPVGSARSDDEQRD